MLLSDRFYHSLDPNFIENTRVYHNFSTGPALFNLNIIGED